MLIVITCNKTKFTSIAPNYRVDFLPSNYKPWSTSLINSCSAQAKVILLLILCALLELVGTPAAAQVHDCPQRLLWLLELLISDFAQSWGWRRGEVGLVGLRKWPEMGLGLLVRGSYGGWVPPANPLVLQCLHNSNACCHNSLACPWTSTHDDDDDDFFSLGIAFWILELLSGEYEYVNVWVELMK